MTNMDYVIVGMGPLLADVQDAVQKATRSTPQAGGALLYPLDERASLRVISDPVKPGGTVVQVMYAGDPVVRRHELASTVYAALVASTNWDLTLDSDDTEDVLAERIKSTA